MTLLLAIVGAALGLLGVGLHLVARHVPCNLASPRAELATSLGMAAVVGLLSAPLGLLALDVLATGSPAERELAAGVWRLAGERLTTPTAAVLATGAALGALAILGHRAWCWRAARAQAARWEALEPPALERPAPRDPGA